MLPHNYVIASSQAAAARSGLTAVNWAIGEPRFKGGAATATYVTPTKLAIVGMYGKGAVFTKAKVVVGSDPAHLLTIDVGRTLAAPQPFKGSICEFAMPVEAQDTLNAYIDNANNSEIDNLILFLQQEGVTGASRGSYKKVWVLRGTSSTADVAHTWGAKTVTWDNAMSNPKGKYHILGMSWHSTLGVCARIYHPDNPNLRPGCCQGVSSLTNEYTEFQSGSIVEFQGDQLGNLVLEALGQSTSNDHVINLIIGEL